MTALYLVGDVFDRVAELRRRRVRVALVLCSPPFLALRSYLPDGHPLKGSEIGSEATPAAFIDVMLALVAELAGVLEPWGSIAFELGDTYAGSGGAGGDYLQNGLRDGQLSFGGSAKNARVHDPAKGPPILDRNGKTQGGGDGWPESKSLAGIPEAFMLSLAYGYNVLDRRGPDSPAGRWRVRNFKPWIRSNPPVGALGDKERPATSYVTVATRDAARYFDLDAVRTPAADNAPRSSNGTKVDGRDGVERYGERVGSNAAGAPPRDWWHHVDAVLDACLDDMAGKPNGWSSGATRTGKNDAGERGGNWSTFTPDDSHEARHSTVGARGVHLRRALERAGILATVDAIDRSPKGYRGAHYAVWPPELVKQLVLEMCPRRVCTTCGQPSRRITSVDQQADQRQQLAAHIKERRLALGLSLAEMNGWFGYSPDTHNWETSGKGLSIPNPGDWPLLKERLGLSAEFDALVLGDRRWTESTIEYDHVSDHPSGTTQDSTGRVYQRLPARKDRRAPREWSDCGHGTWTPGRVLDPFVGSGTTLQVCTGLGRDSIGIDLDYTNVGLAIERVGMWLTVEWPPPDLDALEHRALGPGSPHPASYDRWAPLLAGGRRRGVLDRRDEPGLARLEVAPITATYKRPPTRALPAVAGQLDLLGTT